MAMANGQVWLITGCSTGFGMEMAKLLLARGERVVVTARRVEQLDELVRGQENALAVALDVTKPEEIVAAVTAAEERFGRIDVLVNNAGYGYLAAIEEGEDAAVRAMFETNFFGLVALTKAVLPGMRERRSGTVVNVSSIGGLVSFGATGYYHATKYALEGMSESLAIEVAPLGIKVMIVEPGPFRTDWSGRSILESATVIDDYGPTAGKRRRRRGRIVGSRSGIRRGGRRRLWMRWRAGSRRCICYWVSRRCSWRISGWIVCGRTLICGGRLRWGRTIRSFRISRRVGCPSPLLKVLRCLQREG